jgi:altronate dehydratase small subunit
MPAGALMVHPKDNVATAVRALAEGQSIGLSVNGEVLKVAVCQNIPFGYKVALKDIQEGEAVFKYGEIIGLATAEIKAGQMVHVHNVEGLKGRGDKR